MNHILLVLLVICSTQLAMAQEDDPNPTSSNFEPSLFVVVGVLSLIFFLTFTLIMYAKFCYHASQLSTIHNIDHFPSHEAMFGPNTRFSGIERSVVESLPYIKFSSLKGSKHGLQCSVCLAEFEEIQTLRLLPKCKHGFHVECIDQWLERHSSCPLCRQRVSPEDLIAFINISTSMRSNNTGGKSDEIEADQGSSVFELFVERENDQQQQQQQQGHSEFQRQLEQEKGIRVWHRLNHQIVISDDVLFKNRWSNVTSSDLMFLNSEMLGITSSERFSSLKCHENDDQMSSSSRMKGSLLMGDKRAMSEITALSRVNKDLRGGKVKIRDCLEGNNDNVNDDYGEVREDIKRKLWFPIAKRTVEWFANRETNRSQLQCQETVDSILNV
ncbi:hypothetical protein Cgig2_018498 [Carnegiea gigantea]|uniref:RING-type E3 ubiquitin transferase n=1 Tax=Carnegiea gigantea TaxID=171969 RepID=A0A9Q1GPV5_9CARY|nr:hypothetical protein Cgig2_018498 [Carnegiea gigantea]